MEQLTGQDASFLYAESPHAPLHVGGIAIYDQSTIPGGGPLRFKEILRYNQERLHLAKSTRRKLVRVPFDLDHPYWVEDKNFDLEYHIRHIALPRPANWRQLYILAARILATPLDMTKPPWESYYVEGLENVDGLPPGCFAVISKTHHCAIDGASSVDLSMLLHDLTSEPKPVPPPTGEWRGEDEPSPQELMLRTFGNNLTQPLRMAQTFAASFGPRPTLDRPLEPVAPVPRTRFNRAISPHRTLGFARFPLDEIRTLRKRVPGATVNDAAVALCGGALRRYLKERLELPDQPLVAMAPVNLRTEAEKNTLGNKVGALVISTGTHLENPAERLAWVHRSASQSKAIANAMGARQMTDAMQFVPGALMVAATRYAAQAGLANFQQPAYNTTITNVPGPQVPLYSMGARLVTTIGYGPLTDGLGLMFPVGSYNGDFTVSFTACREIVPDPELMEECLRASYADMRTLL